MNCWNMQSIYLYFIFSLVNDKYFLLRSKAVRASLNLEMYKKKSQYTVSGKASTIWQKNILIFYVFQFSVINHGLCKILVKYTQGLVFLWNCFIFQVYWVVQSDKPSDSDKTYLHVALKSIANKLEKIWKTSCGSWHISRYFTLQIRRSV